MIHRSAKADVLRGLAIGLTMLWLTQAVPARGGEADVVLEELTAEAFRSSPLLARARAAAEAGEARIDRARSAYLPAVGLSERYTRTNNAPAAFSSILQQGRLTAEAQQNLNDPETVGDWASSLYGRVLLFDFGRRRAGLSGAKADADRLRLQERAAIRDVRYAVSEAYYGLLRARAAVGLWRDTVRLFEAHESLTRSRYEAGAALRSDLLLVGVKLAEARENLVEAKHAAETARARLAIAVGVGVAEILVPDRGLGQATYEKEEEGIVRQAREAHPAIAALDAAHSAALHAEKAEARGNWPALTGEVRGEWHGTDSGFGLERDSFVAAVALDVPVFDAGRSRAARAEAAARRREVEAARRQTADALELAARTAHRQALESVERVSIAGAAVTWAEEALRIVEERYRAGLAPIVALIEAERALTEARVRSLDARALAWVALAAVERVAGAEEGP
jgi:outer membrane protein TolC